MITRFFVRFGAVPALAFLAGISTVGAREQAQPAQAQTAQAPPSSGIDVPADYVIGPEDVLGVMFWRDQEMSGDVTVRPDGMITLPLLGDVRAAGLTPGALKEQIQAVSTKFLNDANVTIVVRQINSRKVFITGQVATPGSYPLTGPRTVLQLIALAGGLNEYADSKNISIMRVEQGRTRSFKFNYKDVAKGKNLQQNIQLLPGDTVVVP